MHLIVTLVEMLDLLLAYAAVYWMLDGQPLPPRMRRLATTMSLVVLTSRIIRIQLTGSPMHLDWVDMPLPQAIAVTVTFGTLADMGPLYLVIGGVALLTIEILWAVDTWEARGRP